MPRQTLKLPDEKLERLIALREARWSWVNIQNELDIDRRTAKRAYEDWQRRQSNDELRVSRQGLAEAELRNHLHLVVAIAGVLVQTMRVPAQPKISASADRDHRKDVGDRPIEGTVSVWSAECRWQ